MKLIGLTFSLLFVSIPALAHNIACKGSVRDGETPQEFAWQHQYGPGYTGILDYEGPTVRYLGRPLDVRGTFFKYDGKEGYTFYLKAVSCVGFNSRSQCVGPSRSVDSESGSNSIYLPLYKGNEKIGEITCEASES